MKILEVNLLGCAGSYTAELTKLLPCFAVLRLFPCSKAKSTSCDIGLEPSCPHLSPSQGQSSVVGTSQNDFYFFNVDNILSANNNCLNSGHKQNWKS